MTDNLDNEIQSCGYDRDAVASLIKAMDADAADDSIHAAWRRYVGLAQLSIAAGIVKDDLIATVFGPGVPASKTFQNCYSIARKSYPFVLDEAKWISISALPVVEALEETLLALDEDMNRLSVTSKNAYDAACGRLLAASKSVKEASDNVSDKNSALACTSDSEETSGNEEGRPPRDNVEASALPEDDVAEISTKRIIGALQHTPKSDLLLVANRIIERIELRQLQELRDEISRKIMFLELNDPTVSSAQAA
ncbi:hypothetical protein NOJ05_07040 [Neorhizobium galegae]|uniref:hypothetical protein n=1 Tax=Neorhizobium galegae TaxID=399 RepID=UPI000622347D|nr:hypothetical protein [Neorhizobium galegae]CDZ64801.1 Hypothetical protein NGAL_HAMBI2566_62190 [Neorhizobium galegae bv. orientalis]KAB1120008.1 hypothetical protein F4V90_31095 [Neorhizobium galegae]MCQ1776951.1 hypothetical protein [Neorhizobium galegae]MCQ1795859.1 hypothetical protein [Neorhizobium galegae]MCQ1810652.1 hypothetical protein [Neorhizobium galegae]